MTDMRHEPETVTATTMVQNKARPVKYSRVRRQTPVDSDEQRWDPVLYALLGALAATSLWTLVIALAIFTYSP